MFDHSIIMVIDCNEKSTDYNENIRFIFYQTLEKKLEKSSKNDLTKPAFPPRKIQQTDSWLGGILTAFSLVLISSRAKKVTFLKINIFPLSSCSALWAMCTYYAFAFFFGLEVRNRKILFFCRKRPKKRSMTVRDR